MSSDRVPALVLFDIDGTLIRRAGPDHRNALVEAIRRGAGMETTIDGVPVAGMLDRDIVTEMMRMAGATERQIRRAMPGIVREAQAIYASCCPDLTRRVCPGVRRLLPRLTRHGVVTGLVTGNLSSIGWRKMELAGLRHHFGFGAFAESARDRAGLVRMAMRRARREQWIRRTTPVFLVGDHINDIRAARANGVRSIAVATGVLSADELAAHSPDYLLSDLRSLKMEMILDS